MNDLWMPSPSPFQRAHKEWRRLLRRCQKAFTKDIPGTVWDHSADHVCPGGFRVYWGLLEAVQRHHRSRITGDSEKGVHRHCLEAVAARTGTQQLRALCIGCLEADRPEVEFLRSGLFREVVVMDIARGLLERQQAQADAEGLPIHYLAQDLNTACLPKEGFDFIYAAGTIHHIEALEHLFAGIRGALKPHGLFAMNEFVGPDRFQWTEAQLQLVNAVLTAIPQRFRIKADGRPKDEHKRPRLKDVIRVDPSEAIRSSAILPTLQQHLTLLQSVELGGALLHPLLDGIADHFDQDDEGRGLLQSLIAIDQQLTLGGLLPNNFLFTLATR